MGPYPPAEGVSTGADGAARFLFRAFTLLADTLSGSSSGRGGILGLYPGPISAGGNVPWPGGVFQELEASVVVGCQNEVFGGEGWK